MAAACCGPRPPRARSACARLAQDSGPSSTACGEGRAVTIPKMVAYFRNPVKRTQALALCCIAACGIIAAFVSVILSGTKTGAVLSVGLTVGPALLYAVITAPVAFP